MPTPTQMTRKPLSTLKAAGLTTLMLVAACSAESQSKPNLAGACQMTPCVCADTSTLFWQAAETVPIQWQRNGDASCPPGYALVRSDEDKNKKKKR